MSWKPDRYAELRSFLRRHRVEEEVDEELRHHLEMRIADNVAAGMSPSAARDDAARRFGNYDRIRVETAGIDRLAIKEENRMELLDTLRRDPAECAAQVEWVAKLSLLERYREARPPGVSDPNHVMEEPALLAQTLARTINGEMRTQDAPFIVGAGPSAGSIGTSDSSSAVSIA